MSIKKQEFYEGAALHRLAQSGRLAKLQYEPPFFFINGSVIVLLKYSTKGRSPWGFTFTTDEQKRLREKAGVGRTFIGLICGADGVAAFSYEALVSVCSSSNASVHVACYRGHREHYEVSGPQGTIAGKIAPSNWQNILAD